MFNFKRCNIDKNDRVNRTVIGVCLVLASLFHFSKIFFILVGLVLILEGVIGWCGIPLLVARCKSWFRRAG